MSIFRKWYWEVGLSVGVVCVAAGVFLGVKGLLQVLLAPLPFLAGMWTFHLLIKDRPNRAPSDKARCPNCGHILQDITELRCPKCGERI